MNLEEATLNALQEELIKDKEIKIESNIINTSNMVLETSGYSTGFRIVKEGFDEINICTGKNMLDLLETMINLSGTESLGLEQNSQIPEDVIDMLKQNSDVLFTINNYKLNTLAFFNNTPMTPSDLAEELSK